MSPRNSSQPTRGERRVTLSQANGRRSTPQMENFNRLLLLAKVLAK